MRSRATVVILAVIVAAAATIWRGRERPSIASTPPDIPDKLAKGGERISSAEARVQLARLLDGSLKAPPLDDPYPEARHRYYKTTSNWLDALSLADCIALIESGGNHSSDVLHGLYRRYGELDAQGAIARLDATSSSSQERDANHYLRSYVIEGWARNHPAEAWAYYRSLDDEYGENPLGHELYVQDIFARWSKQDAQAAYAALIASRGADLAQASIGYYAGLPGAADFTYEASRLKEVLDEGYGPIRQNWPNPDLKPERVLPLLLVRNWANRDPDAALAWWLQLAPPDPDGSADDQNDSRLSRTGSFAESWIGEWQRGGGSYSPDAALRWIEARPDLLQSHYFASQVLPAMARHRPKASISLIAGIESTASQARWLVELVQPPRFSGGYYTRQEPSDVLDPSLVEDFLPRFHFDEDQVAQVLEAIRARREHDATKPPPSPSVW